MSLLHLPQDGSWAQETQGHPLEQLGLGLLLGAGLASDPANLAASIAPWYSPLLPREPRRTLTLLLRGEEVADIAEFYVCCAEFLSSAGPSQSSPPQAHTTPPPGQAPGKRWA